MKSDHKNNVKSTATDLNIIRRWFFIILTLKIVLMGVRKRFGLNISFLRPNSPVIEKFNTEQFVLLPADD